MILHWKLEPASEEEKVKVGVGSLVRPEGPESMMVSGRKVIDREAPGAGARVDVAGRVGGADVEGVGAVGERCEVVFGELQAA